MKKYIYPKRKTKQVISKNKYKRKRIYNQMIEEDKNFITNNDKDKKFILQHNANIFNYKNKNLQTEYMLNDSQRKLINIEENKEYIFKIDNKIVKKINNLNFDRIDINYFNYKYNIKMNLNNPNKKDNKTYFNYDIFKDNQYIINNNLNYNIIKSLLEKNNINRNINNILFNKIKNFDKLNPKEIKVIGVTPDGNCFYNSISLFLFSTEEYNNLIRQTLYNYIINIKDILIKNNPYIDYYGKLYSTGNYINFIKDKYFFAGDLEISQAIYCFNINIAVYTFDKNENIYKIQLLYERDNKNALKCPLCILEYIPSQKHYQLLYYYKSEYPNYIYNEDYIDTAKKYFRIKAKNYNLDDNKDLLYKV